MGRFSRGSVEKKGWSSSSDNGAPRQASRSACFTKVMHDADMTAQNRNIKCLIKYLAGIYRLFDGFSKAAHDVQIWKIVNFSLPENSSGKRKIIAFDIVIARLFGER